MPDVFSGNSVPNSNRKGFALGFVTYLPPDDFALRIALAIKMGFKIYIHDNSPETEWLRRHMGVADNVDYSTTGRNAGLGVGLSRVCARAYADNFEALLFFDQDTIFDETTMNFIEEFYRDGRSKYGNQYSVIGFSGGQAAAPEAAAQPRVAEVSLVISSGSLFFLKNLQTLGWHNKSYFVDGVDYELCLRSRIHSMKIGSCVNTPGFDHISGQPDKITRIRGRSLQLRRYSARRIADTTQAYARLVASSIRLGEFRFAATIVRAYVIYSLGQILARIILT
jgi:rhamnosyltransferase